ncbi:ester cyclase [Rhizobium deserti]|uniref:ester cyclase n=1 Tax=Rhizobium deserti TaxID=2547961 RepID=UPI001FDF59DA|nr:ester cyclase [Rhizobium deserti]
MDKDRLVDIYGDYIACLNRQEWSRLGEFVSDDAVHNGRQLGMSGYRQMLEKDFDDIPDLYSMSGWWFAIRPLSPAAYRSTAARGASFSACRLALS